MIRRSEIVELARSWRGTPFKHQGRTPFVGLDCAGVLIAIGHHFKISEFDVSNYAHFPQPAEVRRYLGAHLIRVETRIEAALPGRVGLFADQDYPVHMGIFAELNGLPSLIHSSARARGVTEQNLDAELAGRLRGIYEFPGVE